MELSGFPADSAPARQDQQVGRRLPNERDAELVRQMIAGDGPACASFYDRFAPVLFSMIHAILRDQEESEVVLENAIIQMWKRISLYDGRRGSLFTWAVMIARHKALDRLRSRQSHSQLTEAVANQPEEITAFAPVSSADALLAGGDERDRVQTDLRQVGAAERQALDLAFFSGLTPAQISAKLGAPLGDVKARLRRGLLSLAGTARPGPNVNEELEEQATLYVFGLLEDHDATAFEKRLENDAELRAFVDDLDETAAACSYAATARPLSPELRARVLARVGKRKSAGFPPRANRFAWPIAACLAIACSYLVAERGRLHQRITALEQRDVLAQIQVASLTSQLKSAPDANAIVVWDQKKQRGLLKVRQLPANDAGHDYQLWLIDPHDKNPVDGGGFHVSNEQTQRIHFRPRTPVREAKGFAISLERKGGVTKAEGPTVLLGK